MFIKSFIPDNNELTIYIFSRFELKNIGVKLNQHQSPKAKLFLIYTWYKVDLISYFKTHRSLEPVKEFFNKLYQGP